MFWLLTLAIFRLHMNPKKVVIQDLIWAVYSGDVGDEVGTRSCTCHIMCVEHVCILYTYPIRMYCATIYKNS